MSEAENNSDLIPLAGHPPPKGMHRVIYNEENHQLNTVDWKLQDNIQRSIRRMLPQVMPDTDKSDEIIITGGGPSLKQEWEKLRQLHFEGKKIIATNGSANYLVENNIRPSAVVIVDARPWNAAFVEKPIPNCKYFIASQCDAAIFNKVMKRDTYIFHCVNNQKEIDILNDYYGDYWFQVEGGSTVVLRTIVLAKMLGYSKMHVFGFDSCYLNEEGHSYPQEENDDEALLLCVLPDGREFTVAKWHVSQVHHFVNLVKKRGNEFQLAIYGEGLISNLIKSNFEYEIKEQEHNLPSL